MQKGYNSKVLETIDARLEASLMLLKEYEMSIDSAYITLPPAKQELVTPVNMPDEAYIEKWYAQNPGGQNNFHGQGMYYTNRGEMVRSKSEKIIADIFDKHKIKSKINFYKERFIIEIKK